MNKMLKLIILTFGIATTQAVAADSDNSAVEAVSAFEQLFGVIKGKRRNHVRGFCIAGELNPVDVSITEYSASPLFTGKAGVIGRLSHKDGYHSSPDNKPAQYGLGLSITTHTGEAHMMSMNTLDFFPVATPEVFTELMQAKVKGSAAVKAFKENSTDLQRFKAHMAKKNRVLTPYEGSTYNSINSFYLVNKEGKKTAVRWSFVPATEKTIVLPPSSSFYFENMQKNLEQGEIGWNMVLTIANPEDDVANPAIPWEGNHQQIIAAKLTISSIQREEEGKCESINFDPLILSSGFAPSEDPILKARRSIYAVSFGRRISERGVK